MYLKWKLNHFNEINFNEILFIVYDHNSCISNGH